MTKFSRKSWMTLAGSGDAVARRGRRKSTLALFDAIRAIVAVLTRRIAYVSLESSRAGTFSRVRVALFVVAGARASFCAVDSPTILSTASTTRQSLEPSWTDARSISSVALAAVDALRAFVGAVNSPGVVRTFLLTAVTLIAGVTVAPSGGGITSMSVRAGALVGAVRTPEPIRTLLFARDSSSSRLALEADSRLDVTRRRRQRVAVGARLLAAFSKGSVGAVRVAFRSGRSERADTATDLLVAVIAVAVALRLADRTVLPG